MLLDPPVECTQFVDAGIYPEIGSTYTNMCRCTNLFFFFFFIIHPTDYWLFEHSHFYSTRCKKVKRLRCNIAALNKYLQQLSFPAVTFSYWDIPFIASIRHLSHNHKWKPYGLLSGSTKSTWFIFCGQWMFLLTSPLMCTKDNKKQRCKLYTLVRGLCKSCLVEIHQPKKCNTYQLSLTASMSLTRFCAKQMPKI